MFILPDIFDINYFANNYEKFGRANNDNNNKIRENIILSMSFIDDEYFSDTKFGIQWTNLKNDFDQNMKIICQMLI